MAAPYRDAVDSISLVIFRSLKALVDLTFSQALLLCKRLQLGLARLIFIRLADRSSHILRINLTGCLPRTSAGLSERAILEAEAKVYPEKVQKGSFYV